MILVYFFDTNTWYPYFIQKFMNFTYLNQASIGISIIKVSVYLQSISVGIMLKKLKVHSPNDI